ncbi:WD40 repeat-like protein [Sparassis latifolia]
MASASVAYISASTNRHSHAADASTSSLIAFGCAKLVALWDVQDEYDRGVYETLPGHEGLVTCVRFIQDDRFVSADDKGWKSSCVTQAHQKAVSALAALDEIVVTGSSDSSVKVWSLASRNESGTASIIYAFDEVQTIPLRGEYPLSLAVSTLPQTQATILAIGGTDRHIQIWTRSEDLFVSSVVLSGHEDWIKGLAFRQPVLDDEPLILASGSQDATIRLWNVEPFTKKSTEATPSAPENDLSGELLDAFEASLGDLTDAEEGGRQISLKRHILTVKSQNGALQYSITFDALLVGHEAGVTSLSWRPRSPSTSVPTLLSTSTDSSLILWSPSTIITPTTDGSSSIWINRQRFGDVGGQRLGGFVGGLWTCGGLEASAWGWSGGWRRWRCSATDENAENGVPSNHNENWGEVGAISGHNAAVRGLSWSPNGEYLISAGLDQTTRIHGEVRTSDKDGSSVPVWHELARPQVHGYDLVGVAFIDALRFVSIADEKVARVFEAPREFVDVINNLGTAHFGVEENERPRAATVPPLGLSNKAVSEVNSQSERLNDWHDADRTRRRPFEGELAAITLWPEIEKVFGHGYESIALAVSSSKKLTATACKATSPEHAVIRVYDTDKWQPMGLPLAGHALTVTQIAFSPDDRFILSVSRDRSWRLFERNEDGYAPITADKSHSRIIWDCAWAHEGDIFATASRDKTVKIWHPKDTSSWDKWTAVATIKTKEAATAIGFSTVNADNRRRLAVGLESGGILIYSSAEADATEWRLDLTMNSCIAHVDQIHRLIWRPYSDNLELASCSEDSTLKILTVRITTG